MIFLTRWEILKEDVFQIRTSSEFLFDEIRIFFIVGLEREVAVEPIHHKVVWNVENVVLEKLFKKINGKVFRFSEDFVLERSANFKSKFFMNQ